MSEPPIPDRFSEAQSADAVRGAELPDLAAGLAAIGAELRSLPARPGVYRMLDARGDALYVGKARNLKARVYNYVQPARLPGRLLRMVAQTRSMVIVTTATEAEALLLEANLIKRLRPAYNVLLRDDKSFPYIFLREDHDWPQLTKHRGSRKGRGVYYGPFASAGAVTRTLNALQKVFLLRSCSDSFFQNRSRPCLLHQIKRCAAPCVGRIEPAAYAALIDQAKAFLSGRSQQVQELLAGRMATAADAFDYEGAAVYRDRLRALALIQAHQTINADIAGDADVIALASKAGTTCIQVFFIRGGQNWGNRAFFPRHDRSIAEDEVLTAFLSQFYDDKEIPRRLLLDRMPADAAVLAEALTTRAGRKVSLDVPQRGRLTALVETASRNAGEALDRRLAESASQARHLQALADLFDLDAAPARIEVYDNSHIQGSNAVGGMIVAGPEGFLKGAYRKFNIRSADLTPGDDFGMMREVLERRFGRLQKEDPDRAKGDWPDLVLIDGGRGQLNATLETLAALGVEDVPVVGVAKGPDRNAGREIFHLPDGREISLEIGSPALFFLQRLRDEAHRFAIGAHRAKRARDISRNPLDDVPGIGAIRKRALLRHFGSGAAVARASVTDLQRASGISEALANAIYAHFHPSD